MSSIIGSNEIPALFNKFKNALVCLILLSAVLTAYHSLPDNDFVAFDDNKIILQNSHLKDGLSWENVKWAFTTNYFSSWHPITWLSFMLDYELYGLEPGGFHLTSLILHAINTIILYFALLRLTVARPLRQVAAWPLTPGSEPPLRHEAEPQPTLGIAPPWGIAPPAVVAILFAVHPINVETVAWASERKGLLAATFGMLALWSYAGYARRPSIGGYLPVMAFMSLGLMAKQTLVTLPLILLLLDYWPLGRFRMGRESDIRSIHGEPTEQEHSRQEQICAAPKRGAWARLRDTGAVRLVVEKLPLFALSIISGIVVFILQHRGGMMSSIESFPLKDRLSNVFNSYFEYVKKLLLPDDLACFYPPVNIPIWRAALCVIFMAAMTAAVIYARREKYLLTGWLWYVVTLLPVIGLVQTGDQSMADRYAYIPTVGLFIMAVWGAADIIAGKQGRKIVALLSLSALIISFTVYTRTQVRYWKNYLALFSHAAKVTQGNYVAYVSMGNFIFKMGKFKESLVLFSEALKSNPQYAEAQYSTGLALLNLNRPGEAVGFFTSAIALRENFVDAYNAKGAALLAMGKPLEAVALHKKAIALNPDYALSYNGMGMAYFKMGDLVNAADYLGKAIKIDPAAAYYENLQTVRRAGFQRGRGRTE